MEHLATVTGSMALKINVLARRRYNIQGSWKMPMSLREHLLKFCSERSSIEQAPSIFCFHAFKTPAHCLPRGSCCLVILASSPSFLGFPSSLMFPRIVHLWFFSSREPPSIPKATNSMATLTSSQKDIENLIYTNAVSPFAPFSWHCRRSVVNATICGIPGPACTDIIL